MCIFLFICVYVASLFFHADKCRMSYCFHYPLFTNPYNFFSYVSTFRVKSDGLIFLSKFFSPEFIVHMNSCVCVFILYFGCSFFRWIRFFSLARVNSVCVMQWWKYSRLKMLFSVCSAINLFGMVFCPWPMHAYDTTVILFFGSKPTFLFWFDVWLVFEWCFEK